MYKTKLFFFFFWLHFLITSPRNCISRPQVQPTMGFLLYSLNGASSRHGYNTHNSLEWNPGCAKNRSFTTHFNRPFRQSSVITFVSQWDLFVKWRLSMLSHSTCLLLYSGWPKPTFHKALHTCWPSSFCVPDAVDVLAEVCKIQLVNGNLRH